MSHEHHGLTCLCAQENILVTCLSPSHGVKWRLLLSVKFNFAVLCCIVDDVWSEPKSDAILSAHASKGPSS